MTSKSKTYVLRAILLAVAPLLSVITGPVAAQSAGTDKPLRIVVGYPAGQTTDSIARSYAAALSKDLGRPVVVDNKAGANGVLGAQEAAKAAADGSTIMLGPMSQMAINPALYKHLPYDPQKDFAPIALIGSGPLVLVANPLFPPNNLKELIAYARQRPGQVNYASGGNGITGHLAMEILQVRTGIKLNHIPYKGSPPALNDVIGGQVPLMFDPLATTLPHIKAGKLKAIAVTSNTRNSLVGQDVETLDETVKGLEIQSWLGFFAPSSTPPAVLESLSAALQRSYANPDVQNTMRNAGLNATFGFLPSAQFASFLSSEIKKWGKAAKDANLQID